MDSGEVRAGGGGVLEIWSGEVAREGGDWNAGVLLVLRRAREVEPGLFPEQRQRRSAPAAERSREGERRKTTAGPCCNFRKV